MGRSRAQHQRLSNLFEFLKILRMWSIVRKATEMITISSTAYTHHLSFVTQYQIKFFMLHSPNLPLSFFRRCSKIVSEDLSSIVGHKMVHAQASTVESEKRIKLRKKIAMKLIEAFPPLVDCFAGFVTWPSQRLNEIFHHVLIYALIN